MWDGMDRRKSVRAQYPCLITLRRNTASRQDVLTHTEDLSVLGVRASVKERMELTAEVDLEIDLLDTLPNIIARGNITWIKKITQDEDDEAVRYDIGIQFSQLKDEDRQRIQHVIDNLLE